MRLRIACVKHIMLALLAVALLLGAVEVGLRVHHSCTIQSTADHLDFTQLSAPSWKTHHFLKPLKSTVRRNPDTHLPVSIRTNSLGLRGQSVRIPKPSETYRIVYLGDDTVFASEVEEDETFCQLIQKKLHQAQGRKVEVINAGVPNYCPLLSYLQFKHYLSSLQPDLLVLHFDLSDIADDHYYRRHAQMGSQGLPYLCTHPSFQVRPKEQNPSLEQRFLLLQLFKRQLGLLPADENRANDQNTLETPTGQYAWTRETRPDWEVYIVQALSPLSHLQKLAHQMSCPFVVTLSPVPWQISEKGMPDPVARQKLGIAPNRIYEPEIALEPIRQYLNSQSIPYCDVTKRFQTEKRPENLYLNTTPQLSRRGHQIFAEIVGDYLARTILSEQAPSLLYSDYNSRP
ncbi:MAG: SGNH/GDSL hydrolase family protein [Planctomycetaceae bacterium]|nr:SGNH/GDSL hydrolase family protein [Planctomycetaceae bacterium]